MDMTMILIKLQHGPLRVTVEVNPLEADEDGPAGFGVTVKLFHGGEKLTQDGTTRDKPEPTMSAARIRAKWTANKMLDALRSDAEQFVKTFQLPEFGDGG